MVPGSRTEGGTGTHLLSARVRKTIQSIKEIVGNHSDADIYVALKEANMDPNETTQKLLNQGWCLPWWGHVLLFFFFPLFSIVLIFWVLNVVGLFFCLVIGFFVFFWLSHLYPLLWSFGLVENVS